MSKEQTILFGGYFHPFPYKKDGQYLESVEHTLDRKIDITMWYQQWGAGWGMQNFNKGWMAKAGERAILIKWEPWKPGVYARQPRFSMESIVSGKHDRYIRSWATQARDWGGTLYLCPFPEMNGSWEPWSAPLGGHAPADSAAAWRYIHRIFSDEGASNVKWVWSPNAGDQPADNRMEAYYPGSEYVDVLGLSAYNWGTARTWSRWQSFSEVFRPYYDRIIALGDQPVWITEMGCSPQGGDKASWIGDMLAYLPNLPRLEAIVWFDMDKETDWRITANPEISRLFGVGPS